VATDNKQSRDQGYPPDFCPWTWANRVSVMIQFKACGQVCADRQEMSDPAGTGGDQQNALGMAWFRVPLLARVHATMTKLLSESKLAARLS
jgi:hypothetical protein